jgi:CheY-like chemotaxis protein
LENKLILLVEDNPDDEALTLRALKKNNIANQVVVARDGVEALDYLFGTGAHAGRDMSVMPQVILLDLKLPKVDGFEVLRRLRADERTKLLPVVILTTSNEEKDRLTGYGLGANSGVWPVHRGCAPVGSVLADLERSGAAVKENRNGDSTSSVVHRGFGGRYRAAGSHAAPSRL